MAVIKKRNLRRNLESIKKHIEREKKHPGAEQPHEHWLK